MITVTKVSEWLDLRKQLQGKTIGLIPTMGHLHAGHMSLCERSKSENDLTVVSIFVNPAQFNQQGDFDNYPRTLAEDKKMLEDHGVQYLLLPTAEDMYPDNYEVKVSESIISAEMEGEYRPGHFDGMMTVVLKLLNLAQATRAYFGEKDYQQLLLIQKMAKAFFLATEIIGCKTMRADDDLALSSRNSRLSVEQRAKAAKFPAIMRRNLLVDDVIKQLNEEGFKVDYIADKWDRRLGAVWLGDVRLIDNIERQ